VALLWGQNILWPSYIFSGGQDSQLPGSSPRLRGRILFTRVPQCMYKDTCWVTLSRGMQDIARRTHNTLIAAAAAAAPSAAARRCDDERGLALVCLAQRSNKNIERLSITSLFMPVACQYVTRAGCRPGMPSPTVFFQTGERVSPPPPKMWSFTCVVQ